MTERQCPFQFCLIIVFNVILAGQGGGGQQGQKFVAVIKAKNRGAATSQNAKNRGIVAAKIVKIAAMSRQKLLKSRLCRGKLFENRG